MLVCYVSVNIPHCTDMNNMKNEENIFAQILQKSRCNLKNSGP